MNTTFTTSHQIKINCTAKMKSKDDKIYIKKKKKLFYWQSNNVAVVILYYNKVDRIHCTSFIKNQFSIPFFFSFCRFWFVLCPFILFGCIISRCHFNEIPRKIPPKTEWKSWIDWNENQKYYCVLVTLICGLKDVEHGCII